MYGEEEDYYQPRPRSPIPAAVITAILTSTAMFFGLRELEARGVFGKSEGPIEVPSILGMNLEEARTLLKARGLLLSLAAEREDAKYAAGTVAAQTPLPGSQAAQGHTVSAEVSRGMPQAAVPNLVGLSVDEAFKQLTDRRLQPGPQRVVVSDAIAAGLIVATDPAAGASVPVSTIVNLTVSSGPAGKPVPKVVRLRLAQAKAALEQAGFKVGPVKYIYDERYGGNVVLAQEPGEGAPAPAGTTVNLTVNEPD